MAGRVTPPGLGLTVNGTLNVANDVTVGFANTNHLTRGVTHTLKVCVQEGTMLLLK